MITKFRLLESINWSIDNRLHVMYNHELNYFASWYSLRDLLTAPILRRQSTLLSKSCLFSTKRISFNRFLILQRLNLFNTIKQLAMYWSQEKVRNLLFSLVAKRDRTNVFYVMKNSRGISPLLKIYSLRNVSQFSKDGVLPLRNKTQNFEKHLFDK